MGCVMRKWILGIILLMIAGSCLIAPGIHPWCEGWGRSAFGVLAGPFAKFVMGIYIRGDRSVDNVDMFTCALMVVSSVMFFYGWKSVFMRLCTGGLFLFAWCVWLLASVGYFTYWR